MEKKNLHINCGLLDVTSLTSETLENYEKISANCAVLVTTPETSALLARVGAQINAGHTVSSAQGVRTLLSNGCCELTADTDVPENSMLMVNGKLRLFPGADETIAKYHLVLVNGQIILPESVRSVLGLINLNGNSLVYPDGADFREGGLEVSRRLARMAKENALYYVIGAAFLMEEGVDVEVLLDKNVVVHASRAYVSSAYPDGDLLFDENTEIRIVPEGCAFVRENLTLDSAASALHGRKICVAGDVRAEKDAAEALAAIEEITVHGTAFIAEELLPLWSEKCHRADRIEIIKPGRLISDTSEDVLVGPDMLALCPDGLRIRDCVNVLIDPAIEPALLAEKILELCGVACCVCTEQQQSALHLIANETFFAREKAEEKKDDGNTIRINAGTYSL